MTRTARALCGAETPTRRVVSRALTLALVAGVVTLSPPRRGTARPASPRTLGAGPALFGVGVFTTPAWDFFVALTPDQKTAYFCRANGSFSYYTILESHFADGRWSEPRVAPLSGRWSDADPHIAPNGRTLFFISNRSPDGGSAPRGEYDIWYVERRADGAWSEPKRVAGPVNTEKATEWSPSVAANGNLYFGTVRPSGKGAHDIYVSRFVNGTYTEPENLGDSLNTTADEVEPWVAPDESYLIFSAQGRPDGLGGFDLYISHREGGVWQKAHHLGHGINSSGSDFNQSVSPDGRWLYFSSTRSVFDTVPAAPLGYVELQRRLTAVGNGLGDIYRVEMSDVGVVPPR